MSAATWITPLGIGRGSLRVAVKDLIDVAGTPTTAGSRAVAEGAEAARSDAECLAGLTAALGDGRARLVGKTNLHELALGITGINPWFGTPRNPLDPHRIPGGSSSGSAVAVASWEADVAIGTDTGGSVRIPAACCGVCGLKTTFGRISNRGVWPLAPSLDTVGPLARDIAGIVQGMDLLEPGFAARVEDHAAHLGPIRVGRVRVEMTCDRRIEAAVDGALRQAEVETLDVALPGWADAARSALDIIGVEALAANGELIANHMRAIGSDVAAALSHAAGIGHLRERSSRSLASKWRARLDSLLEDFTVLALPTMGIEPPGVDSPASVTMSGAFTSAVNLAGLPALSLPLPSRVGFPASLQLVGAAGGEEHLCVVGARIEAAASSHSAAVQ